MSDLYVVRTEEVPVEKIVEGDTIVLPSGRQVTVDRVDEFDEGMVVRWFRRAETGEPGATRGGVEQVGDEYNGRYYGSLMCVPRGHTWTVTR